MTPQDLNDFTIGEIARSVARIEANVDKLTEKVDAVQFKSAAIAGAISALAFVLEVLNPFKRA